ncbi:hypothetical protein [Cyanobium sp. WAJ14-Wanaka]|uniref:hypothetical protein n=1 Tax=Cyanobium sp. WAJ14-Wanaka TaxID=2823725 RepID=UPI0020CC8D97|nr:hypothetical protein [Cyanobium sp. WAJ14-Wanaka]MCP9774041.1 hypothetical protein [Cyanobium sp. WAJ14-Wanaka]
MAAPRLSDSQKSELVERYRAGEASQALAELYGCSVNTVSRVVKAALPAAEYELLKAQRAKGAKPAAVPKPAAVTQHEAVADPAEALDQVVVNDVAVHLAIDDADDFGDELEDGSADSDPELEDPELEDDTDYFMAIPIALVPHHDGPVECQPLADAVLPASVYMLVDKTVELQAKPLKEFTELGLLPADEEERQALMVFSNPRQAKRQCGRSQRVIKVPDTRILERTAPYLIAQGISRVVCEGSLYSLPGS